MVEYGGNAMLVLLFQCLMITPNMWFY